MALSAFVLTAGAIALALPLLRHWSLAIPDVRSSHRTPVSQAGGVFVMAATLILLGVAFSLDAHAADVQLLSICLAPALTLCVIGAVDDRWNLPAAVRLFLYAVVCLATAFALPDDFILRLTHASTVDRVVTGVFLLTFVNIVNFMDGIDGIVVVEFAPMLMLLTLGAGLQLWSLGLNVLPSILLGALLGFFVFNRPKARIFLGDAGSIPIGFLVGLLLVAYARSEGVIAALLLPAYFLADALITLLQRVFRREKIWLPHRQHFYQKAFDAGQGNWSILMRVGLCNVLLCGASVMSGLAGLCVGAILLLFLLRSLRKRAAD